MNKIKIVDTTLRDGEQTAGVVFSTNEKMTIARLLDSAGVDQIEAGIPAMGGDEEKAVYGILSLGLKARISTWNRAVINDIKKSIDCGVRYIHISVPVSDIHINYKLRKSRKWVIESLIRAVGFAKEHDCWVSVGAEDASRADFDFLVRLVSLAEEHGAEQIRYADTVSQLHPFNIFEHIRALKQHTKVDIEIHTHNDFGLATANALAAVRAGANLVNTTVIGLGERAGNAPLEDVVMALNYLYKMPTGINAMVLPELSRCVAEAAGRVIYQTERNNTLRFTQSIVS